MERTGKHIVQTSFMQISIEIKKIGEDLLILASGGNKPHIGCVSISVPRLSLKGDGQKSCTSSVWNLTGHKDEEVCRKLSEAYCRMTGQLTICTGGIHLDNIQSDQIKELMEKIEIFIQNEWRY